MSKKIADIMTDMPIVARVPGTRNDAINLMVRNKLTGLPVIRESDGQLMGIVSRRDVFRKMDEDQLSLIMKQNPVITNPDETIENVAKTFNEKRFHRLPVVDNKKLVGIVTPTALIREIKTMSTTKTAEDAIKEKCVTCFKDDPLSYAVAAMKISDVSALPVLDEKGKLVGIITDRDLFDDQIKDLDALKKLGIEEISSTLADYRNVLPLFDMASKSDFSERKVSEFMVKSPKTVYKKMTLDKVAKIMYDNDFGQLPVFGEKDELIGMIYDVDVLIALVGE